MYLLGMYIHVEMVCINMYLLGIHHMYIHVDLEMIKQLA